MATVPKKNSNRPVKDRQAARSITKRPAARIDFDSSADLQNFVKGATERESHRLVTRSPLETAQQIADDAEDTAEIHTTSGKWGARPTHARQATLHPDSVRPKAPVTLQYVMSDKKDVDAWNALQKRMLPLEAPEVSIGSYESAFSQSLGSFVILVSFSEIEYQQL